MATPNVPPRPGITQRSPVRRPGSGLICVRVRDGRRRAKGWAIRGTAKTPKKQLSYGVFKRCGTAHLTEVHTCGVVQTYKPCLEPTFGIEPETSFLPSISLPALWHTPGDPERIASNYGVVRFPGPRLRASIVIRARIAPCSLACELSRFPRIVLRLPPKCGTQRPPP